MNLPWRIEESRTDHGLMLTAHDARGNVVRRETVQPKSPEEAAFRQGVAEINAGPKEPVKVPEQVKQAIKPAVETVKEVKRSKPDEKR